MRGVIVTKIQVNKQRKINIPGIFKRYLLKPITGGAAGYLAFLTLMSISKFAGYLIGSRETFKIDSTDMLLSLLGFVFIFIIKFKENLKGRIS